jgi:hypothetical protein
MIQVLSGEVEEGEQSFSVLGQACDRLLVFGAVFVGEHVGFTSRVFFGKVRGDLFCTGFGLRPRPKRAFNYAEFENCF